jgi:Xaa-Pro dipeptidase
VRRQRTVTLPPEIASIHALRIAAATDGTRMNQLSSLYHAHLATLKARTDTALANAGYDALLIHSGSLRYQFLDDRPYPYRTNPHFKHWLPLTRHPDCWIAYRPGHPPLLIYQQPEDYWHEVPAAPAGYWVEHFDIRVVREPRDAQSHLPAGLRCAVIAEGETGLDAFPANNPKVLLDELHYHRASKTEYELVLMRQASLMAARGHIAAAAAFHAGLSEYQIHLRYVEATGQTETDLPYGNIVALNENAAVLHYQYQRTELPLQHLSFLIDAGAEASGYAADITRTYARHPGVFADMIDALDTVQRTLCDMVKPGQSYPEIHLQAHRCIGDILQRFKLVRMSAESQVESGVTRVFFPHGIGHLLGLQVHDVAGFARNPLGESIPKPPGHPFLRLTRELACDHVVTIEPGIYFIDSLLRGLVNGPHAGAVAWSEVDALRHYGGIRIEDNVRACASGTPENLSRDAFAAVMQ